MRIELMQGTLLVDWLRAHFELPDGQGSKVSANSELDSQTNNCVRGCFSLKKHVNYLSKYLQNQHTHTTRKVL